jgi:hypothetical protein
MSLWSIHYMMAVAAALEAAAALAAPSPRECCNHPTLSFVWQRFVLEAYSCCVYV